MLRLADYPPAIPAAGRGVSSIDPALLGTWKGVNNEQFVIALDASDPAQADAAYFSGGASVPYRLENGGQALVVNNSTQYARQEGAAASLVGRWRDHAGGEELTLRADGRYMIVLDDDPMVWFGTYQATANAYVSYEFRSRVGTQGNQIFYSTYTGYRITGNYALAGNTLTVMRADGGVEVYQRV